MAAARSPLTEQDIDSLEEVMEAIPMLQQYGVSVEGLTSVEDAKTRLRRKLLEDSGRRILRKQGDAANMMKDMLQRDKETRQELLQLCDSAIDLLMTTLETDVQDNLNIVFGDINEILTRCRNQLVKDDCPILVAGETSSGKSTLLNVLLGENILPSSVLSTTSAICEIKYSTTKKAVIHLRKPDPTTKQKILELPLDGPTEADRKKISQYIHIKGEAREAESNCNKVEMYWPLPPLEGGILIVDSPGVGESEEMDEYVSKYISEAYAFMYVINSANAGGVQPGRLLKLVELSKRMGPEDLHLFDPKAAIFVCNKWDQVPDHDKEKVKRDTLRKLKQHWPLLDESQLFCLSALEAQKAAGYVTDDLDKLLDGINSLVPHSLRHKLTLQHSWISILIKESTQIVRAKLNNATRSLNERVTKAREVRNRLNTFERFTENIIKKLQDNLQDSRNSAKQDLTTYLERDETKALIVQKTQRQAPSLNSTSDCDSVREQINESVQRHIQEAMQTWFSSEGYFQDIEDRLIKEFKDSFKLIEGEHHNEIDQALSADVQVDTLEDEGVKDNDVGLLQKVVLGVTAPLWIPVVIACGVLAAVAALPIVGFLFMKKRLSDNKFMEVYKEDKEGYIRGITDEMVGHIDKTNMLEGFVDENYQRLQECLIKLKGAIPDIIKKDKQLIKVLEKEKRQQKDLFSLYNPQLQECNALQEKLARFEQRHLKQ